jgi:hypothetical protein
VLNKAAKLYIWKKKKKKKKYKLHPTYKVAKTAMFPDMALNGLALIYQVAQP